MTTEEYNCFPTVLEKLGDDKARWGNDKAWWGNDKARRGKSIPVGRLTIVFSP